MENFDFQFCFRDVRGRSGCLNTSSVVSRTWSKASGDQLFFEKNMFPRTPGNVLISILALSDRQTEPSGVDLGLFSYFTFFIFTLFFVI